jgi:hypothetical protein
MLDFKFVAAKIIIFLDQEKSFCSPLRGEQNEEKGRFLVAL